VILTNPFPGHDHDLYPIEIGIGPKSKTRTAIGRANVTHKCKVKAYSTCCDSLYVHRTYNLMDENNWTVSHGPTGAMVMTGIPDERTAMYLAGAVSKLWWWVHPKDAGGGGNYPDYQKEFNGLPSVLRDWIMSWGYRD
jgi:hypothetical protein